GSWRPEAFAQFALSPRRSNIGRGRSLAPVEARNLDPGTGAGKFRDTLFQGLERGGHAEITEIVAKMPIQSMGGDIESHRRMIGGFGLVAAIFSEIEIAGPADFAVQRAHPRFG